MASVTAWTVGDMAKLVELAMDMVDDSYCEGCGVVSICPGDKYCLGCANDIVEYLAAEYMEMLAVQEGWY